MVAVIAVLAVVLPVATALRAPSTPPPQPVLSRRALVTTGVPAAVVAATMPLPSSAAVTACKPGANNCWSTASSDARGIAAWTWPAGQSRAKAVGTLRGALEAYPQAGQASVDLGGWSYAEDALDTTGYARLEFKSGIGNFAKFFNGGKPFVDDLELSVGDSSVAVKSASRVGDSDLGVNSKRLNYIAKYLRDQGWDAPGAPDK
mmetsp:Transcript_10674/g.43155  ORF Transcript_10674/g.43155 Transcript_10674/m.43155 type:complete len:204 (-) Transcript_10674:259-870(-)|eukprot:CAMPEP_0185707142 /NCGR_PEP_ID=MMETSP1164-20130828/23373_1 /TAXON_ID=1104430 /ORGANISM="Chrysoreinhardia sp, Strain CCMP2950" /LENGTH=203 /DNA_ID=CAMNT_0028374565 /DNA_START=34 /DNA_END=645 /DNA_ORIENTATION=+